MFESFGGTPEATAVKLEKFDAGASFVSEDVEAAVGELVTELAFDDGSKSVKALTEILRGEDEVDFKLAACGYHSRGAYQLLALAVGGEF